MALSPIRKGPRTIFSGPIEEVEVPDVDVVEDRLGAAAGAKVPGKTHARHDRGRGQELFGFETCDPVSEFITPPTGCCWIGRPVNWPHDPDIPSTVQLGVPYDPQAKCPAFDQFDRVVPPDVVETVGS